MRSHFCMYVIKVDLASQKIVLLPGKKTNQENIRRVASAPNAINFFHHKGKTGIIGSQEGCRLGLSPDPVQLSLLATVLKRVPVV